MKVFFAKEGDSIVSMAAMFDLETIELARMNALPDPWPIPVIGQAYIVDEECTKSTESLADS